MGILNATPDSFSDGGQFLAIDQAVAHAVAMVQDGADLIDIGGESTRPGSLPVPADQQIARVCPILRELSRRRDAGELNVTLSIDTTRAEVAAAALDAGADLVNDISAGGDDPTMFGLVAERGVPIVLMHMQGTPATMQIDPQYHDVVEDVSGFLTERVAAAVETGIAERSILVDPGIGFGKTSAHNLELIRRTRDLTKQGRPLLVGVSRKGFVGKITGESDPAGRVFGTAAAVAYAAEHGAAVVRVHDVKPMSQVVRMIEAIQSSEGAPPTP